MMTILRLKWKLLRSEWPVLAIMMVMALMLIFFFGQSMVGEGRIIVSVVDEDGTEASAHFLRELEQTGAFAWQIESGAEARKNVEQGMAIAALWIEEGFAEAYWQGEGVHILTAKDSMEAYTLRSAASDAMMAMAGKVRAARSAQEYLSGKTDADAAAVRAAAEAGAEEAYAAYPRLTLISDHEGYRQQIREQSQNTIIHYCIGFGLFFSMFGVVFGVGQILEERKLNTLQRWLVSPVSKASLIGGNMIANFVKGFVQIALILLAGRYLFAIDLGRHMGPLLAVAACFTLATAGLGMLLSGLVKTHEQLGAVTPVVLVSTSMLGGCMWPLEIIRNQFLLTAANIAPQKWAVSAMEQVAMYGGGWADIWVSCLVLAGMALVFFGVGTALLRME